MILINVFDEERKVTKVNESRYGLLFSLGGGR